MERRLLLVFALTFLIILASQPLLKKYGPKTPEPPKQSENAPATAAPAETKEEPPATVPVAGGKKAAAESETVVENDLYRIRFTNRGAQVKSWVLKKYKDDKGQPLELVQNSGRGTSTAIRSRCGRMTKHCATS